nr:hypothetical protein [Candidatus Njordarchaeota archaeon]
MSGSAQTTIDGKTVSKPQPTEVREAPKQPQQQEPTVFELAERRDENQIVKELQGEIVKDFFYSFKNREGREVTGLSWVGVKECGRRMGHIRMSDLQIVEKEDEYQCTVKATDTLNNLEVYGVSTANKWLKPGVKNTFALQICVSKAQRNAIRALLPEKLIAAMLKRWATQNRKTP